MAPCPAIDWEPTGDEHYSDTLTDVDSSGIAFGIMLVVGGFYSVVPQHTKIFRNRTSEGVNVAFVLLLIINLCLSIAAAVALKMPQIYACQEVGWQECSKSVLTVYQLVSQFLITYPLAIVIFAFYPKRGSERPSGSKTLGLWVTIFLLISALILSTFALVYVFASNDGPCSESLQMLGKICGVVCVFVNLVQVQPQIWKTFLSKRVGSFSIKMMCIQTPGAFALLYFQAVVQQESIFVWIGVLSNCIQLTILLLLLMKYAKFGEDNDEEEKLLDSDDENVNINGSLN